MMMGLTKTDWAPGLRSTIASWAWAGSALFVALWNLPGVSSGAEQPFTTGSSDVIIQEINSQIRESWKDNEVEPSPVADDSEWIRRVYLDIVGHIPALEDVEKFLADKDKAKRTKLIEKLLDDPGYTRNWTTIWTNLCIGQQTPRRVSRDGMQKFFREAFGKNRPWKDVVSDLVTAEGHYEENGAANFLLAQMQDQDDGVQMTAKTTRLFMGMQVQCTQCHDHPFNDWKQDQFWQFNSFFRQTGKIDHRKLDPKSGRMVDDFSEIIERDFSGPVYFEKRNGLMKVAYPAYLGAEINSDGTTERRKELARLMSTGERPMIALAYINRLWAHFFGYGFTNPIDDIGSHIPVTHPALFDRLAEEFVKSGYDCKQAMRWIANSEPYNLTSRSTKKNARDNPAIGESALFSHLYVKPMSAEQLYDSLIVATNAHKSGRSGWEQAESQRHEWLQKFVQAFGTDDGGESSTFDGTIPQALMMMNGPLVQDAVSVKSGSHLHQLVTGKGNETNKIQRLYLTALSRTPNKAELAAAQKFFHNNANPDVVYQDLFWALLNSNEFIFNH
jgi:hypothetical protein